MTPSPTTQHVASQEALANAGRVSSAGWQPQSQGSAQDVSVGSATLCEAKTGLGSAGLWSPSVGTNAQFCRAGDFVTMASFHLHHHSWPQWDKRHQPPFVDDQTEAQCSEQRAQGHIAPRGRPSALFTRSCPATPLSRLQAPSSVGFHVDEDPFSSEHPPFSLKITAF